MFHHYLTELSTFLINMVNRIILESIRREKVKKTNSEADIIFYFGISFIIITYFYGLSGDCFNKIDEAVKEKKRFLYIENN